MTAIFIITSNNKKPQSLNRRHSPCTGVDTMALSSLGVLEGGVSKVRRSCQSTIVGGSVNFVDEND